MAVTLIVIGQISFLLPNLTLHHRLYSIRHRQSVESAQRVFHEAKVDEDSLSALMSVVGRILVELAT